MPQLNPIVLKDAQGTNRTFTPADITGGVATLVLSTGVPIGDRKITISNTQTATGRRKVNMKFTVPIVQDAVVGGISKPTVVRTAYGECNLTFDGTSTFVERADYLTLLRSLLSETTVIEKVITNLENTY